MSAPTKTIPFWSLKGLAASTMIFLAWASSLAFLLSREITLQDPHLIALIPLGMLVQTFLYTGLFITAHDAMHGIVFPSNRRINDLIGSLAVLLYALFSFRKLREKHHEHHDHPGAPGDDPDFHDGEHRNFWRWYLHFVGNYVGVAQIVGMAIVFNVLEHLVGVPIQNLLLFWVAPSLLSTLQLFYFGTFLPHRGEHDNPHNARSNAYSEFWSLVTCYHFGYHLEHHQHPWSPWWHLPTVRRESA